MICRYPLPSELKVIVERIGVHWAVSFGTGVDAHTQAVSRRSLFVRGEGGKKRVWECIG